MSGISTCAKVLLYTSFYEWHWRTPIITLKIMSPPAQGVGKK